MEQALPFILFFVGVVARVVVPYLTAYLKEPIEFDWRYLVGQIVGAIVALVAMLVTDSATWVAQVGTLGMLAAFLYGWASGDIGREMQKGIGAAASFER